MKAFQKGTTGCFFQTFLGAGRLAVILLWGLARQAFGQAATPTLFPTEAPPPTFTFTITDTPTATDTPQPTDTPFPTNTPRPTRTPTGTPTITDTPNPTETFLASSFTPTETYTPRPTRTPTPTPTDTGTSTSTGTETDTYTITPTPTISYTPTITSTPLTRNVLLSNAVTISVTGCSPTPTITSTATQTATSTFIYSATHTATATMSSTTTATVTSTLTGTASLTTTSTATATLTSTATFTTTFTVTATPTLTATVTPSSTATLSPTITDTFTVTSTATVTATFTTTATATLTATFTPSPTPSLTATHTATSTPSFTATLTDTATASATPSFTFTPLPRVDLSKVVSTGNTQPGDLLTYTLGITVVTQAQTGVLVTDQLPSGVTYIGPGVNSPLSLPTPVYNAVASQLTWNLPTLSSGIYQLTYQTRVNDLVYGGSTLINQGVLTYGTKAVTATAPVTVSGSEHVVIGVYNEAGELVATLLDVALSHSLSEHLSFSSGAITQLSGTGSAVTVYYGSMPIAVWNGFTGSGTAVTNGVYHVKVDNIDPLGVVTSQNQQVTVSRNLAQLKVTVFNEAGETVKQLYLGYTSAGGGGLAKLNLSSSVLDFTQANSPEQILITTASGTPTTFTWDGRSDAGTYLTAGRYFVEVYWTGTGGDVQTLVQGLTIMPGHPGAGLIYVEPNLLTRATGTQMVFRINTSDADSLTVRIYDLAGELVTRVEGPAGNDLATWDAKGLASGVYLAAVEVTGPAGFVGRQTVKFLVVH